MPSDSTYSSSKPPKFLTSTTHFFTAILFFLITATSLLSGNEFDFEEEESTSSTQDPIRFELICEEISVQPGRSFWVALDLNLDEHWHAYWKHPGDIGMPLSVEWTLPQGFEISELEWPFPKKMMQNGFVGFGFENSVTLLAKITPSKEVSVDDPAKIEASIRWLVCSEESCLPGETSVSIDLSVKNSIPKPNPELAGFFEEARALLPQTTWVTTARIQDGLIDVLLQIPDDATLASAYFCPESKDIIDTKTDIVLSPSIDQRSAYHLLIKSHNSGLPPVLKGVLVIEVNGHLQALDIDLPLNTDPSHLRIADNNGVGRLPTTKTAPHLPPNLLSSMAA